MNTIRIVLGHAGRERQDQIALEVPAGTTLQQGLALHATQIAVWLGAERAVATGVWGSVRPPDYVLRDGDRIEIYRPLKADPKQARRARAADRKGKRG